MSQTLQGELVGRAIRPYQRKSDVIELYDNSALGQSFHPPGQPKLQGGVRERVIKMDMQTIFNLAAQGLDRRMVAYYYGTTLGKFNEYCEMLPDLDDAFNMGMAAGVAHAAQNLSKNIEAGNVIAQIFKLKSVGGWIEEDKKQALNKNQNANVTQVQIMLPDNGRDSNSDGQDYDTSL